MTRKLIEIRLSDIRQNINQILYYILESDSVNEAVLNPRKTAEIISKTFDCEHLVDAFTVQLSSLRLFDAGLTINRQIKVYRALKLSSENNTLHVG